MTIEPGTSLQVLLAPVISEKSTMVGDKHKQFVFRVRPDATKAEIKAAVELLFKVEGREASRSLNVKGKEKRLGRFIGQRANVEKAYVSLKAGQEINFAEGEVK